MEAKIKDHEDSPFIDKEKENLFSDKDMRNDYIPKQSWKNKKVITRSQSIKNSNMRDSSSMISNVRQKEKQLQKRVF